MRITHSEKISDLLTNLARKKQLKHARPLALYSTTSNTAAAEELVKRVCTKYPGTPDLIRGVARTSDTSFFFDKPEAVVVQELEAIKPRRKGKTAPKVKVKMVYTRVVKLWRAIQNLERIVGNDTHGYYTSWVVPTLTREALVPGLNYDKIQTDWGARKAAIAVGTLLERDDITEDVVDEAWVLFQTHRVMEE